MSGLGKILFLRAVVRLLAWSVRMTFRYLTGRPMNGRLYTDASRHLFRRGTRALTPDGHASRWAMLPGWQRAAWRVGAPVTFMLSAWGYQTAPALTFTTYGLAGAAGTRRAVRAGRRRHVRREYIEPTAATLAPVLKQDPGSAGEWVHIPAELVGANRPGLLDRVALPSWVRTPMWLLRTARAGRVLHGRAAGWLRARTGRLDRAADEAWIRYPSNLMVTEELRRAVSATLAMKLGGDEWIVTWHGKGARPHISIKPKPQPPELVTFADVAELVAEASDSAPILGLSASGPVAINLDTDAPHVAASCGSGAGKSILLRGLIAQWLHNGTQVVILDGKRVSQSWCKDLPGVRYCRTGEQLHNALMELSAEVNRRFDLIDSVPAEEEDTVDVGPRIVCVFEEQNIGMQFLAEYWQLIKPKGAPNRSEAQRALDHILCAGRQAKMHVVSVAQLFTVQASGGNPAARENYGPRIMARATRNAWMMLAPECLPFPKSSKRRGRMHLAFSGDVTEFQSTIWTVGEARAWATSGAAVTVPAGWTATADQRHRASAVTHGPLLTLAGIARENVIPMTYGSLRNAKSEAGGSFPDPVMVGATAKYRPDEVKAWYAARSEKSAATE
ncbi:MAG: hypothetical protein ACJ768_24620 [Gaiellaceae bacterium]